MTIIRTLKVKGWTSLFIAILLSVYLLTAFQVHYNNNEPAVLTAQSQQTESNLQRDDSFNQLFSRLTPSHRQILISCLVHIRLGYVANRTPHYSTPPLLINYSCKNNAACGSLDQRLTNIVNAYYFAMMQPGTAFAYDMNSPVKMEWFFDSAPTYMAMTSDQAKYYLERARPQQILNSFNMSSQELLYRSFYKKYESEKVTIVNARQFTAEGDDLGWMSMSSNPAFQALRDKYRLNHVLQKSDWFWIASKLLFSKPSTLWFRNQLEPYRDLMGGKLDTSDSISIYDPNNSRTTPEFAAKQWLRIGLRVTQQTTKEEVECLAQHIQDNVCKEHIASGVAKSCHVFVSAPNKDLLKLARQAFSKYTISVHAVAEGYNFRDLDQTETDEDYYMHGVFKSEEEITKKKYARVFMDWIILSRMDYLVGQEGDGFLKTAAWAAQVQTDVGVKENGRCYVQSMSDW